VSESVTETEGGRVRKKGACRCEAVSLPNAASTASIIGDRAAAVMGENRLFLFRVKSEMMVETNRHFAAGCEVT
jgi:hypothetical protein